jgi:hypothetical protein
MYVLACNLVGWVSSPWSTMGTDHIILIIFLKSQFIFSPYPSNKYGCFYNVLYTSIILLKLGQTLKTLGGQETNTEIVTLQTTVRLSLI